MADRYVAVGLVAVCATVVALAGRLGDYPGEAGPAVAALVEAKVHAALSVLFWMGPFAIAVRVPFAWIAAQLGAADVGIYRAGIVPCVGAAAAVGLYLARPSQTPRLRRDSWLLVVPVLAVLSPPSLDAVRLGHPEELLGGALAVAAVLLALRGRGVAAGVALGLAVATKQWAVLAVAPAILAAQPAQRARLAAAATVTATALYLPLLLGNPHLLFSTSGHLANYGRGYTVPEDLWFLVSHPVVHRLPGYPDLTIHHLSPWFGRASRDVIVFAGLPLGYMLSRRATSSTAPLALLALLFLFRCALDPGNLSYFHLPFLLALLAWEVEDRRLVYGLPLMTLMASLCLWLTFGFLGPRRIDPWVVHGIYITWAGATTAYLLQALRPLRETRLLGGWLPTKA